MRRGLEIYEVCPQCGEDGPLWFYDSQTCARCDFPDDPTGSIANEIAQERDRQKFDEGFDPTHDDRHNGGELAAAAATYAYSASLPDHRRQDISGIYSLRNNRVAEELWPFENTWWKPTDRRRDLIKAAALMIAEVERLDRAEEPKATQ